MSTSRRTTRTSTGTIPSIYYDESSSPEPMEDAKTKPRRKTDSAIAMRGSSVKRKAQMEAEEQTLKKTIVTARGNTTTRVPHLKNDCEVMHNDSIEIDSDTSDEDQTIRTFNNKVNPVVASLSSPEHLVNAQVKSNVDKDATDTTHTSVGKNVKNANPTYHAVHFFVFSTFLHFSRFFCFGTLLFRGVLKSRLQNAF